MTRGCALRRAATLAASVAFAVLPAGGAAAIQPMPPPGLAVSAQAGAESRLVAGAGHAHTDRSLTGFGRGTSVHRAFPGSTGPVGQAEGFFSSLILPGLSQYRQGNRRWIAYAGIEVLFVAWYLDARADTRDLKTMYRDFAWTRARSGLSSRPRQDGDFEYYERLSRWARSGAWDADPMRAGLQPESDPATYNGSVWALAGEIYNVDAASPERSVGYERALAYYREYGYGPSHLWAWRAGSGDQDDFRAMIADSDSRAGDARRALWIVTANHLLSAIDGFITARVAAIPPAGALGVVLTAPLPWQPVA